MPCADGGLDAREFARRAIAAGTRRARAAVARRERRHERRACANTTRRRRSAEACDVGETIVCATRASTLQAVSAMLREEMLEPHEDHRAQHCDEHRVEKAAGARESDRAHDEAANDRP